jgi:hypothetical protein
MKKNCTHLLDTVVKIEDILETKMILTGIKGDLEPVAAGVQLDGQHGKE